MGGRGHSRYYVLDEESWLHQSQADLVAMTAGRPKKD